MNNYERNHENNEEMIKNFNTRASCWVEVLEPDLFSICSLFLQFFQDFLIVFILFFIVFHDFLIVFMFLYFHDFLIVFIVSFIAFHHFLIVFIVFT